jgi:two-component system chemotaxis sensor kinase CheA
MGATHPARQGQGDTHDHASILQAMLEALNTPLDRNDLGRLAHLHGHCEQLLNDKNGPAERPTELLNDLRGILEHIIVDEIDDAAAGLARIPQMIADVRAAYASGGSTAPMGASPTSAATTSPLAPATVSQPPAPEPVETAASEPADACVTAILALAASVAEPLGVRDLGRLALAHTHSEELATATQDCPTHTAASGVARAIGQLLERVILDEISDAAVAVAAVQQCAIELAAHANGDALDAASLLSRVTAALAGETPNSLPEATPDTATITPSGSTPVTAPSPVPAVSAPPPPATAAAAPAHPTDDVVIEPYVSEPLHVDLDDRENLQGFVDESQEHLQTIEAALLEVERHPHDVDKINELFRPFHTIKGIAGFLNLRDVNRLTHEAETILDMARKGTLQITTGTIDLIFASIDVLKAQIAAVAGYLVEPTGGPVPQPPCAEMIMQLRRAAAGLDAPAGETGDEAQTPPADDDTAAAAPTVGTPPAGRETRNSNAGTDLSIRVDTAKLDSLVDTVGERVIAQTMVNLNSAVDHDEGLRRAVSQVTKIVRDVQETAMRMRMVPIGQTFQKMRRLVRDVSRKAGKQVELIISGEETELDKNVIQKIADPLVHMVRNAVDHGVEAPEQRRALGKPPTGYVYLDAYHEGDNVVIEIRDDGRGLDRAKLIAKGIERGLIGPDDSLTDAQAYGLILEAGFSTAEQITDISGRGVGMDVVKRNIEELRGTLDIDSQLGQGSTFRIKLPLTLAIIDGMIIRVGDERMVIPTILIDQSLRPEPGQITAVQQRGEMLQVREELCSLVQVGELFGLCPRINPSASLVVVAHAGGQKIGLVVSELIGQQQIVIKSLGEEFKGVQGVSGAAILGDGRVGLILEPTGLLGLHKATRLGSIAGRHVCAARSADERSVPPAPPPATPVAATVEPVTV